MKENERGGIQASNPRRGESTGKLGRNLVGKSSKRKKEREDASRTEKGGGENKKQTSKGESS